MTGDMRAGNTVGWGWRMLLRTAAAVVSTACAAAAPPPTAAAVAKTCEPDSVVEGYVLAQEVRCTWGVASQCAFAGSAYQFGLGVERDVRKSWDYYRKACDLGAQDGCVSFGILSMKLGEKQRYPELIPMWERACEAGEMSGCHTAGLVWTGDTDAADLGVAKDVARGRAFFAKGCAARYMLSCGQVARWALREKDSANYEKSHALLIEACKLRERESCDRLARAELLGRFGQKDEAAAALHFWEACKVGLAPACGALAYLNDVGIGVPKDAAKARELADFTCNTSNTSRLARPRPRRTWLTWRRSGRKMTDERGATAAALAHDAQRATAQHFVVRAHAVAAEIECHIRKPLRLAGAHRGVTHAGREQ